MKKFEEELFSKVPCKFGLSTEGEYRQSILVKHFGDWVSPEDHQAEVNKLKNKINWLHNLLDGRNEEVLQTVKRLNEAQPEIPKVPQFVADWYEKNKGHLEYRIWKYIRHWEEQEKDDFYNFIDNNTLKPIETIFAMKNGYTVAKEKRFYLKNKSVLIFDPDSDDSDVEELYLGAGGNFVPYKHLAKIFTQSQIDSMETGSYEQIGVEE